MLLQIYFEIEPDKSAEFEQMYQNEYVPAMQKQVGYEGSRLLRLFSADLIRETQARETSFNYQMELVFDCEENRRKWADSEEHKKVWPAAQNLAKQVAWRGYDVAGKDRLG
jgi:antibiotic biosynthesis monooxygenase (ABM) superfamily enzyme